MAWRDWTLERLEKLDSANADAVKAFLSQGGLGFDSPNPDVVVVARNSVGNIVGTGSFQGNVLKQIMVDDDHRSSGLFAHIVSALVEEACERGVFHLFVFTKKEASAAFQGLGFSPVASTSRLVLLELGRPNFDDYLRNLEFANSDFQPRHELDEPEKTEADGAQIHRPIGGIVMNCNPFTLGHRCLVETGSRVCSLMHVFVVSEDRSLFPTKTRLHLTRLGTKDLKNVVVHEGGPYIISSATFPNYFLRKPGEATLAQAELDATIFGRYIAPRLGISLRFLGEEPLDETTRQYNTVLQTVLPEFDISVRVIPRLQHHGVVISASAVRKAIALGQWDLVKNYVPQTTLDYLFSEEAKTVIEEAKRLHSGLLSNPHSSLHSHLCSETEARP